MSDWRLLSSDYLAKDIVMVEGLERVVEGLPYDEEAWRRTSEQARRIHTVLERMAKGGDLRAKDLAQAFTVADQAVRNAMAAVDTIHRRQGLIA